MENIDNILFLINPKSNDNKAMSIWRKACKKYPNLPSNPLDVTKVNISSIIEEKEPQIIVIAGGDGTINSVANTVAGLKKKPRLCIIPLGFGNALSYCLGVETIDKAINVLTNQQKEITIDLMKTNISGHERGVFNISMGFDARVVFNRKTYRYIGIGSYVLSTVRSFFSHPENEITLTVDDKVTITAKASSLVIANCPIIGQNLVISQTAKLNDGLLDCTLFSTKYAYLTNLRLRGFKHPLYTELGKVRFKASKIRIEGEPFAQIDGDPIRQNNKIEVEIDPSRVTFLRNTDENIDQRYLPFVK